MATIKTVSSTPLEELAYHVAYFMNISIRHSIFFTFKLYPGTRNAAFMPPNNAYDPDPIICVDPRYSPEELLAALAHELVHYDQWSRGDLVTLNGGVGWRGVLWSDMELMFTRHSALPWEIEAIAREMEFDQLISGTNRVIRSINMALNSENVRLFYSKEK